MDYRMNPSRQFSINLLIYHKVSFIIEISIGTDQLTYNYIYQ